MVMRADPVAILARFPGPVRLAPSRRKWLTAFAVSMGFVTLGALLLPKNALVAWLCMGFFALCAVVSIVTMMPGAGSLILDQHGFEITSLFRHTRTRWPDATRFDVARLPPRGFRVVVYDDVKVAHHAIAGINRGMLGHTAGLPDNYGLSYEELALVMSRWRERALNQRSPA